MGGAGGWGSTIPTGAAAVGVGSGMAMGMGAGRGLGVRGCGAAGLGGGGVGGAGGAGGAGGGGGAMNSLSTSAGTITSTAWRSNPVCKAQMPATCSTTTEPAITALRLKPPEEPYRSNWDIDEIRADAKPHGRQNSHWIVTGRRISSLAQDPPDGTYNDDQAACECGEERHVLPSWIRGAGWAVCGAISLCTAATGWDAQHCATTSRAQSSQRPHWVATPSSNWISSKLMPARAWRAISRSEIRRHTQTIMEQAALAGC